MGLVDVDGEIVNIPIAEVEGGGKHFKDGSQQFTLVGGPYHGLTFRVYEPYLTITFKDSQDVYQLSPPVSRSGKWVFVHSLKDSGETK